MSGCFLAGLAFLRRENNFLTSPSSIEDDDAVFGNRMSNIVAVRAALYCGAERNILEAFVRSFPGSVKIASTGLVDQKNNQEIEVLYVKLNDPESYLEPFVRFFLEAHASIPAKRNNNKCYLTSKKCNSQILFKDELQLGKILKVRAEMEELNKRVPVHISPLRNFTPYLHQETLAL